MKIDKIEINNFKLFSEAEFSFNHNFNLIIGINGSGKTSILRALAIALGGWAYAYIKNENNLRPIENAEIREIQIDNRFDKTKNTYIKAYGSSNIINRWNKKRHCQAVWKRNRDEGDDKTYMSGDIWYQSAYDGSYSQSYNLNLDTLGSDILDYIESGKTFDLPLIAFYECDRIWIGNNTLSLEETATKTYSRFEPYIDCFHTGSDHNAIAKWLLKYELVSLQENIESPVLEAIKLAAVAALENCVGIKFDMKQSRVMVEFEDNKIIPFEHLSDGQRTVMGLFCDIARRASILNPHKEGKECLNIEGIVLIDELDLHLHPKWQRNIIKDLRSLFPNIQFITTTHSPHIIQNVKPNEIINLGYEDIDSEETEDENNEYGYKGWTVEEVLEDVMGMDDTRTDIYHSVLRDFERAINEENYQTAEEKYNELDKLLHPNNHLRKLLKFDLISIKED